MFSDAKRHMLYRIGNAPLRPYPYAHLYVEGIFPELFHAALRDALPPSDAYQCLADTGRVTKGAYKERSIFFFDDAVLATLDRTQAEFWREMRSLLSDRELMELLAARFDATIQRRFEGFSGDVTAEPEAYLVKDGSGYSIGPHTDAPHRLLSALFYIPADARWRAHGTSLYVPKDRRFACDGGPHYTPDSFERIATVDYVPNALFAFAKTDMSFHGVEPVLESGVVRDVILYDVRLEGQIRRMSPPTPKAAA